MQTSYLPVTSRKLTPRLTCSPFFAFESHSHAAQTFYNNTVSLKPSPAMSAVPYHSKELLLL